MNEIFCANGLTDCNYRSSTGNCTYTGRGCVHGLNKNIKYSLVNIIKHGYWIQVDNGDCCYKCSECGFLRDAYILDVANYCPQCGAHMANPFD